MASYLRARKLPTLWYQVDEGDADPATLFHYLQQATQKVAPRYRKPLPTLTPEFLPGIHIFTRRFFEQLYARLKISSVLVFDNFQETPSDASVQELLRIGLEMIPEGISLICISREDPPSALARLQVGQAIEQLGEESLRLTRNETKDLIQLHTKGTKHFLSKDILEELLAKTQGWTAGLILLLEQTKGKQTTDKLPTQKPPRLLFDYMANEVLLKVPVPIQEFLIKTSLLPTMTISMAQELTGRVDSGDVLNRLYRTRYFTERRTDFGVEFQYHPLFQEFLQKQLHLRFKDLPLKQLQATAGAVLEKEGHIEDAVTRFQESQETEEVERLILAHAKEMLMQGRAKILERWILSLPQDRVQDQPWMQFWLAHCCFAEDLSEAQHQFAAVYNKFEERRNRIGRILSWCGLVDSIYAQWENFRQFAPWLDRVADLEPIPFKDIPAELEARFLSCLIGAKIWARPDDPRLMKYLKRVVVLMEEVKDLHTFASICAHSIHCASWLGAFPEAKKIIGHLQQRLHQWNYPPLIELMLNISASKAAVYSEDPNQGLELAQNAFDIAQREGLLPWVLESMVTQVYGNLNLGEVEKAKSWLNEMERIAHQAPGLAKDHIHFLAGWVAIIEGDFNTAYSHVTISLKGARENGGPQPEVLNLLAMSQVLYERGDRRESKRLLGTANTLGQTMLMPHANFLTHLLEAYFYGEENQQTKFEKSIRKALTYAQTNGIKTTVYWWRPEMMAKLCAKALESEIEVNFVQDLIRRHNLHPIQPALAPTHWPWPIKILTLGRFAIEIDGQPLQFTGKVPRKPLQLLKALLASGRTEASETYIADQLWPDTEGDAAHKTLVKTVERLRKVLGARAVIHLQDGKMKLDSHVFWIDVWTFEALLAQREEGNAIDERENKLSDAECALELYQGSFLPEDTAEPWTAPLRERLKQKYIRNLAMLCHTWSQDGKGNTAVRWLEQAVEYEPLEEALYQQWMQILHALDRPAEVPSVYERCRKTIQAAAGQEPSEETHHVFEICREPASSREKNP